MMTLLPLHKKAMDVSSSDDGSDGAAIHDEMSTEGAKLTKSLAQRETRVVKCLRAAVICVIVAIAAVVSMGVYVYTRNEEQENFSSGFEDGATQVIRSFHGAVERNMAAMAALSTSFTAYAQDTNQSFPFVTLPEYERKVANIRAQSGSHMIVWAPLVTDDTRSEWEDYALEHRYQWTDAFDKESLLRERQDRLYGLSSANTTTISSDKEFQPAVVDDVPELTTFEDGTHYHPKVYSNGATSPRGDEPEGGGSYLPMWQQSPVHSRSQETLNLNIAGAKVVSRNIIQSMTTERKAILNYAATPIPIYVNYFEAILRGSQYRHDVEELIDDVHTFLAYPVFDSFGEDGDEPKVAGILFSDIYWKVLLSDLPVKANGIICVITNSVNQTFAYRIDGADVTNLGTGDPHDPKYNQMGVSTNVNSYLEQRASPTNRAPGTVHLSDTTQYTIQIYPSDTTADAYLSNDPLLYTLVTLFAFFFAAALFLAYSYVVEHRQFVMTEKVVQNIRKAAETERDLNEFLSHEIRNPLSASIAASTFVSTAINEEEPLKDSETQQYVREDMEVVNASLHFINDFLRSMLDIYRAKGNKITVTMAPTDVLQDILEPVANMLYQRLSDFEVLVECPQDLVVMTDSVRLKQVVINLARNSAKFVTKGFVRLRAEVVNQEVRILVEDSGPGIPLAKQKELFTKYQESLDMLSQGTGIGLNLSKKLMKIMKGELWLDQNYHSGVEGSPGARFVADLKSRSIDIESALPLEEKDLLGGQPPGINDEPPTRVSPTTPMMEVLSSQPPASLGDSNDNYADPSAPQNSLEAQPIKLDLGPQPTITPTMNQPASEPELPEGLSVLFVDDDTVLRKLFMRAVKKAAPSSWTIKEASSGEMALTICEAESFDLIFLDQYMASTEKQLLGTETAQAMRTKGISSKISGLSANDLRDAFINAGADDFILKPMPCKPLELRQVLRRVLSHTNGVPRNMRASLNTSQRNSLSNSQVDNRMMRRSLSNSMKSTFSSSILTPQTNPIVEA